MVKVQDNMRTVKKGDSAWKAAERNLDPTGKKAVSGNAIIAEMKRLARVNGCKDYNDFNKKFFNKVGNKYNVGNTVVSNKNTANTKQVKARKKSVARNFTRSNSAADKPKTTYHYNNFVYSPTYSKPYNPNSLLDPKVHALFDKYNVPYKVRNEILKYVDEACRKYNIDPKLVLAYMQIESSFNPYAQGKGSSAYGLMQLTKAAGTDYCPGGDRTSLRNNIMGGVNLIKKLDNKYGGNLDFMAQGYNQGYYKNISVNNQPAPAYARALKNAYSQLA